MRYKNEKSCSQFGIQSFIDELVSICNSDFEKVDEMKKKLIERLQVCIIDRLYDQQYFANKEDSDHIKNHYNIIKVYFDLFVKLTEYFDVIYVLILSGKGVIKKLKNKGNFTNALFLEIDMSSDKEKNRKEIIPFTDVNQDTSYLYNLDLGKLKMSKYNISILKENEVDWNKIPIINNILQEIKKQKL
jgi:hypothetical protein